MAKRLTQEAAQQLLSNVTDDKQFYGVDGRVVNSVEDLYNAVTEMTDESFMFHRNNSKNDFYNWVLDVIGDNRLANDIARSKTKKTTLSKIDKRIKSLKKIADE